MFKKGQLVRGDISGQYSIVIVQHYDRLLVKDTHGGGEGWTNPRYVTLIGNNYTAKYSKESAPVNLRS